MQVTQYKARAPADGAPFERTCGVLLRIISPWGKEAGVSLHQLPTSVVEAGFGVLTVGHL